LVQAESELQRLVQQLVERVHPEMVVWFGSGAAGAATPESDIDLLVILESELRRDQRQELISQALRPRRVPVDILAHTPAEVQSCLRNPDSFVRHILMTGKVLYERSGRFATDHFPSGSTRALFPGAPRV
jgi:predicted nucleotidyltransferase